MAYEIGDLLRLQVTLTTIAGTVDANATMVLTVLAPDGSTSTPSITNSGSGVYFGEFTTSLAGLHQYRFVASGSSTAAEEGNFYVSPSDFA